MQRQGVTRRQVIGLAGAVGATGLAGCVGGSSDVPDRADVVAGPGGANRFDPEELTVSTGETVVWYFASIGHNVSCRPGDDGHVELPEGADPFASYGPDESTQTTVSRGETYEHTFETPGTYVYVCVPHVDRGMVGRVVVE
ncbi:MAG: plastocyanin/azurin family copper-binding protein [Halobacteriaceae archaeon]